MNLSAHSTPLIFEIMKLTKLILVAAVAACTQANAAFISGSIAFSGTYDTLPVSDDLANADALTFSAVSVSNNQQFGDYSSVPNGTAATFSNITFNPITLGQLWTFTVGPDTYSFTLDSISVDLQNSQTLVLTGTGTASITGFDDTAGTWSITANSDGQSLSFSSGAAVSPRVPDGGTSIALLGLSLLGIAGIRRKLAKK